MPRYAAKRKKLAAVAKQLAAEHRDRLDTMKANEWQMKRTDFLWRHLISSFATMGRAAGWDGLRKPENYNRIRYDALAALPQRQRLGVAESACRDGKVRMPARKAVFIAGCFERVKELGGPSAARKELLSQPGRDGKIAFLMSFPGIGPKYARNIMMDVYHPDFRDSIALDARIKSISEALGIAFSNYDEHERFYLDAARDAGLNGWELDRLMFNYLDEFLAHLR